jgi:hypothetical protein
VGSDGTPRRYPFALRALCGIEEVSSPFFSKRASVVSRSNPAVSSCAAWAERNSAAVIQKGAPVRRTRKSALPTWSGW